MSVDAATTRLQTLLLELHGRLVCRDELLLATLDEANDLPPGDSAERLGAYRSLMARYREALAEMYGDCLPHGQEWRCGFNEHDLIPPCRVALRHSPAGARFISSLHVWRDADLWVLFSGCFAEHPKQSHYAVVLGLARSTMVTSGEMSA